MPRIDVPRTGLDVLFGGGVPSGVSLKVEALQNAYILAEGSNPSVEKSPPEGVGGTPGQVAEVFKPEVIATGPGPAPTFEAQVNGLEKKNPDMAGSFVSSLLPIAGTLIGGPVGGIVSGAASLFGNLFGPSEDTSLAGFNAYLNNTNRSGASFPSKEWIVAEAIRSGFPADDVQALRDTYSPISGLASKGDWRLAITSLTPVTLKWFKGANESFTRALNASFVEQQSTPATSPEQQANKKADAALFSGSGTTTTHTVSVTTWVVGAVLFVLALLGVGFAISRKR